MNYKKLALVVLLSFGWLYSFSQSSNDRLYWTALQKFVTEVDNYYSKSYKGFEKSIIYLETPEIIDSIPNQIGKYTIVPINKKNMKSIYRSNGRAILHTKIFPMKIEDNLLKVVIVPYLGKLRGGEVSFTYRNGTSVYFTCGDQNFEFVKTRNWGY